jgi:C4-dicarboxylate-specific signal transduction histidine kinase
MLRSLQANPITATGRRAGESAPFRASREDEEGSGGEARRSQEALNLARTALAQAGRLATVGEINATIAHEVNQPLAAIMMHAQTCRRLLACETPDLAEVRESIDWLLRDAERAADVIHGIRGLLRKTVREKSPVDLNELVDEVKALLESELAMQRVTLSLSLTPSLPLVLGDRVQLQQVVINLVMNAVEAAQGLRGRLPTLAIRSFYCQERGVVVAVSDNGIGIRDEIRLRLFDTFFTTKVDGLGIGLAICRSIIEDHGGELSAANNGGQGGATFEFALWPLANPPAGMTAS